jgi:26S proteasome regulatory subunit N3
MEVDAPSTSTAPPPEPVPEVEIYLRLLILHHLLKTPEKYGKAMELAHQTVEKMMALNRRSMDPIAAKVWFAVERTYELGGELCDARPYVRLFLCISQIANFWWVVCSSRPNGQQLCGTMTIAKRP